MKEKKNEEVIIGLKHDKDKVSSNKTIILEPKKKMNRKFLVNSTQFIPLFFNLQGTRP